jgi:hypothetical protein
MLEFRESGQRDRCFAIRALLQAAGQRRALCALLDAAGALAPRPAMGRFQKEWKEWAPELRAAAGSQVRKESLMYTCAHCAHCT